MIRAIMLRQNGRLVGFDCKGHADFGRYGQDIVCSAVSALTTTTVNALTEIVQAQAGVSVDEDGGIHCVLSEDTGEKQWEAAELLFQTLELGLRSIESEYPRNLKISCREV